MHVAYFRDSPLRLNAARKIFLQITTKSQQNPLKVRKKNIFRSKMACGDKSVKYALILVTF